MRTFTDIAAIQRMRSLLFVPGSRPERFAKALASAADTICIDLEDAVAPEGKGEARAAAISAIASRVAIRINGIATAEGMADLLALRAAPVLPDLILVPMVESADEIRIARAVLGDGAAFVPLIETPVALAAAASIAAAPGVVAMMFGGADLSASLGVALAWEPLAVARGQFILACAGANVPAIDVPFIALDDSDGLAGEARRARMMGFQAKAAIHPAQVDAINAAMRPGEAEVAEARDALAAFDASAGGAVRFKGRMLEAPMVRRYAAILAMAGVDREAECA